MDFSSNVMIDFGLNLIGYLVITLLIYQLNSRRQRRINIALPAVSPGKEKQAAPSVPKTEKQVKAVSDSEYIPLAGSLFPSPPKAPQTTVSSENRQTITIDRNTNRQENRKAIYREARRLLAGGRSGNDLMAQLPLTENEVEMLSASGSV